MTFDVFLSHNSVDKPAVRHLRDKMAIRGVKCWFDEDNLRKGTDWLTHLEQGLNDSSCCAIFYGASGIGPWHEMERQLAQLMATDAWRNGRHFGIIPVRLPDAPEWRQLVLPPFLRLYTTVEFASLSDEQALGRLVAGVLQEAPLPIESEADLKRPPYIGMRPFTEEDASIYTARNNYIVHVVENVRRETTPRFFAVLGASGSGKSSLLHAGVLPRLRQGSLYPETKDWVYVTMRPGSNAWGNLRAAIVGHERLRPVANLTASRPCMWLHEVAAAALGTQHHAPKLLLIIDQFEELLTARPQGDQPADEQRRREYRENVWKPFAENIAQAVKEPSGPVTVLIAARSDFVPHYSEDDELGSFLLEAKHRCTVQPLTEAEVQAVIERPAVARKLRFDASLVETVVQDYFLDPAGALPFLQEALRRVWELGKHQGLSLGDYRRFGGLKGAVNAHAEAMIEEMCKTTPASEALFRRLFVHLVRVADDGGPDTKRRRPLDELPGGDSVRALARVLTTPERRLLVLDADLARPDAKGVPIETIEIAHESLIHGWKRLDGWLNDERDRPRRLRLRRLEASARSWQQEKNPEIRPDLLAGRELRAAEAVCRELSEEVPEVSTRYLAASRRAANLALVRNVAAGVLLLLVVGVLWRAWQRVPSPSADEAARRAQITAYRRNLDAAVNPKFLAPTVEHWATKILELAPDRSDVWALRARAALEQNNDAGFKAVIDSWEKNVQPRATKIDDLLGDQADRQGHPEQAIVHWNTYLRTEGLGVPEEVECWRKLAAAYQNLKEWNKAAEVYKQWIAAADKPEVRAGLIETYEQLQRWPDYDAAIAELKQKFPDSPAARGLRRMSDLEAISRCLEKLEYSPADIGAGRELVVALTRDGKYSVALERAEFFLATVGENGDESFPLRSEVAHLQWCLGEPIRASLRITPDPQWTKDPARLAASYDIMQQRLKSWTNANERLKNNPRDEVALLTRGSALQLLGQLEPAIADFSEALALKPGMVSAWKARAKCYQLLGKNDAASSDLLHASQIEAQSSISP